MGTKGPDRVAYCECGAQFAAGTEAQLFAAAQAHLAQHHPELMGAFELDVVTQMAEGRPGPKPSACESNTHKWADGHESAGRPRACVRTTP
jgi:hypothetical protein